MADRTQTRIRPSRKSAAGSGSLLPAHSMPSRKRTIRLFRADGADAPPFVCSESNWLLDWESCGSSFLDMLTFFPVPLIFCDYEQFPLTRKAILGIFRPLGSGVHDIANNFAVNVGQPAFKSVMVIGQPFVIETEQVKDRRMKVVYGRHIFNRFVRKFVGRPV